MPKHYDKETYHMFSSKYSSFAYLINSLLFNPYRATLMRTLYRIPFITPLPFIAYRLSHTLYRTPTLYHTPFIK